MTVVPATTRPADPVGHLRRSPASMGVLSESSLFGAPSIDPAPRARPAATLPASARASTRIGVDAFLRATLPGDRAAPANTPATRTPPATLA